MMRRLTFGPICERVWVGWNRSGAMFETKTLSPNAVEMLGQLFVNGPTWDGNVCSKAGRGELFDLKLAFRVEGFTTLTEKGLRLAIEWKQARWDRWRKKQNGA